MDKGLFSSDFLITGHHATKVKELTSVIDSKSSTKIFKSGIELYLIAAIIGVLCNKKVDKDKGTDSFRIFADAFNTHYNDVMNVYKLVLLCADSETNSPENRITRAYRLYKRDENVNLFHSYVYGGIEELHSVFFSGANVRYEDYKNDLINFIADYGTISEAIDDGDEIFKGDIF